MSKYEKLVDASSSEDATVESSPSKISKITQSIESGLDGNIERLFSWSRCLGVIWTLFVIVMIFVLLPWWCVQMAQKHESGHNFFWKIAFWFAFMAVPISMWDIAQHLRHWNNPQLQRHIVRILWMAPIYALESWFSLRYYQEAIYLQTLRECYEAYVIYNFYMYLVTFLRQEDPNFDENLETRPDFPHWNRIARLLLPHWKMGKGWLIRVSTGPVAYVVLRVLMTIVAFGTQLAGVYDEGAWNNPATGYFWVTWILFVGQSWAIYCLVYFYKAFNDDLAPAQPLKKLLVIKFVVFFTWLQGVIIAFLATMGVISSWDDDKKGFSNEEALPGRINDLAICVEMFFVTLIHHRVFSWREYLDLDDAANYQAMGIKRAFKNLFDIDDVKGDVVGSFKSVASLKKSTSPRQSLKDDTENSNDDSNGNNDSNDSTPSVQQSNSSNDAENASLLKSAAVGYGTS